MDTILLSAAIEGFLLQKESQGRSPRTLADYRNTLIRFLDKLGDRSVDTIDKSDIQGYFLWLTKLKYRPLNSKVGLQPLKGKTIENSRCTLNSFWQWCSEEFSFSNPFKIPPYKYDRAPIVPLTLDEVAKMLEACERTKPRVKDGKPMKRPTKLRDRAIILIMFDCGLRTSELIGIRVTDLDMVNKRIFVTGKGSKRRYVYFSSLTAQAIWRYQSQRFKNTEQHPEDYLFIQKNGITPMSRFSVHSLIEELGLRAGIERMHPHRLRHTFAVTYLRNGGDPFSLQNLLGHTDMDMTKKYVNLAQEDLQNIHRRASPADSLLRR